MFTLKGKKKHTLELEDSDDGTYLLFYAYGDDPFLAESGEIMTINFEAAEDLADGEYEGLITKGGVDNADGNIHDVNGWPKPSYTPDVTFKFIVGPATGIENITVADAENAPIYNIAGQKVGKDYKGLVIINGKKIIKK